jgi:hypothetical protein
MSYVRWSSIIGAELSDQEWIHLHTTENSIDDKLEWCKQNKNPECYLSDWYIFWYSMGGEESNNREEQYLAMWNCGESVTPVLEYLTVKQMLETDDWEPLGYETITQKELLVCCVKEWLTEVEDHYT